MNETIDKEIEYTIFFRGSLSIKAITRKEAWDNWKIEKTKIKNLDIDREYML